MNRIRADALAILAITQAPGSAIVAGLIDLLRLIFVKQGGLPGLPESPGLMIWFRAGFIYQSWKCWQSWQFLRSCCHQKRSYPSPGIRSGRSIAGPRLGKSDPSSFLLQTFMLSWSYNSPASQSLLFLIDCYS